MSVGKVVLGFFLTVAGRSVGRVVKGKHRPAASAWEL